MNTGALNKRTLNKDTLNSTPDIATEFTVDTLCLGEFNAEPVNVVALNSCIFFSSPGIQTIIAISQLVGTVIDAQTAISIAQNVELQIILPGFTAVDIVQEVSSTIPSGELIKISQIVDDNTSSFLSIHGFDVDIIINNIPILHNLIMGSSLTITKESNQNTLCEFSVNENIGNPLDFVQFINGGSVVINYITPLGGNRIFTGIVDLPEIDIINKIIKIKCSDRREELIKNQMTPLLPFIGRYSKDVQGLITSVQQEVEYRLQTTPQDIDFDAYNIPNINPWSPRTIADFTLGDSDILYQTPKVVWQSRASVINDISVEIKYQYKRFYHHQRSFSWTDVGDPSFNPTVAIPDPPYFKQGQIWFADDLSSHCTVGMLKAAITGAGWKKDSLSYVDHYPDTLFCYKINFITFNTSTSPPYGPCFNVLNDKVGVIPVKDLSQQGKIVNSMQYAIPPATEEEKRIISAAWTASFRFAQNIEETYSCRVMSSQSINQFGSLTSFVNHNVQNNIDSSEWEKYNSYTPPPPNAVVSGVNFYVNQDQNIADFNNALQTAIDKAKVTILSSHRDTKVSLQVPIIPQLELRHTIQVDSSPLSCKGKTSKIIHEINLLERQGNNTNLEITLLKAYGSAVETPTIPPERAPDNVVWDNNVVYFSSRRGEDYNTTPGGDKWNGYIGSINQGITKSAVPTKFAIDTPPIPDELRLKRDLSQSATYETAIIDDELEILF